MIRSLVILSVLGVIGCSSQEGGYRQLVDTKAPDMAYGTAPLSGVERSTDAGAQNPEGISPTP